MDSYKIRRVLFFIFLSLGLSVQVNAQKILELIQKESRIDFHKIRVDAEAYFDTVGTEEGSGYKIYKRWEYWAERHLDSGGFVITAKEEGEEQKRFMSSYEARTMAVTPVANWMELGPKSWSRSSSWAPGLGRIVRIAVEPNSQNLIFAGSPGGGIWRSENAGQSWTPVGDDLLNMSVWAIAIDPLNNDIVYHGNSSGALMKSINQGDSWFEVGSGLSGTPKEILIHPIETNKIWIATRQGIYYSTDSGVSFSRVSTVRAEDLDFKSGDLSTIYACDRVFQKSIDGGLTFTTVNTGFVSSEKMKMAVTEADSKVIYLVQTASGKFGRIYKSVNSGISFSVVIDKNSPGIGNKISFSQGDRDIAIAVSHADANEVHIGGLDYSRSLDGGLTWVKMAKWSNPGDPSYIHADVEVLEYIGGKLYAGTDGGIFRSSNKGNNMTDLTRNGLAVRQYYRFGNSATDENMLVGGAQDNGTNIMKNKSDEFIEWLGADGMEGFIDYTNTDIIYGSSQFGVLYKSTNGGNSRFSIPKPENKGNWVTPFEIDPVNHNWIYAGYKNLYRHKTGGENGSWKNLSSTVDFGGNIDELKISPSDNNYIYVARKSNMWVTTNGRSVNPSWLAIGTGFSGNVNYISIDPDNEKQVVIATTGSRIYKTLNAGTSWTEISGNLPNIGMECVFWDNGSQNGIYAGLSKGVYYRNDTMTTWVNYGNGLPNVKVTELEIQYASRLLRISTYGRGIWESDLFGEGISAAISSTKTTGCNGDVAILTATSSIDQSLLTYQWYVDGNPIPNETNSTYQASVSGKYYATISDGNTSGQSNVLKLDIVASLAPAIFNVTSCGSSDFVLKATKHETDGVLVWYDDSQKTNILGTGDTLEVLNVSQSTSYFVEELVNFDYLGGAVDSSIGTGGFFSGDQNLLFDTYQNIVLKEVTVYASGAGDRTLRLLDESNVVLHTEVISMIDGKNRISLNLPISSGTNLKIGFENGSDLYRNNDGVSYPYNIGNALSITSSSAGNLYYYYLYDWKIEVPGSPTSCTSPLSELVVEIINNDAPVVEGGQVCEAGSELDLKAVGNGGSLIWYNSIVDGDKVGKGEVYTAVVNNTQSYYVEEVKGIVRYSVGAIDNNIGSGKFHVGGFYTVFTAEKPFVLEKVTVYASGTKNRVLELFDANDVLIESRVINIKDGEQEIDLGLEVPVGVDMRIGFATGADLFRSNSGVSYPYTVPGIVSLTSSTASGGGGSFYYYLYNWKIADMSNSCISPRAEAVAELTVCTGSITEYSNNEGGIYPNPTEGVIFLNLPSADDVKSLQIIDAKGKVVFRSNDVAERLNLKGLPSGLYFVLIEIEGQRIVKKVVLK